jgi:hypothetical protein
MPGYNDPDDPGNSAAFYTGKPCIEPGCHNAAGTAWSPYWCFECNVRWRILKNDMGKRCPMPDYSLYHPNLRPICWCRICEHGNPSPLSYLACRKCAASSVTWFPVLPWWLRWLE